MESVTLHSPLFIFLTLLFLILSYGTDAIESCHTYKHWKHIWLPSFNSKKINASIVLTLKCIRPFLIFLLFFKFNFIIILCVLLCNFIINHHFRGTFNGGSDMMNNMVTLGLLLATFNPSFGLIFIGTQCFLSYWVAGLSKIWTKEWWSGKALLIYLKTSCHEPSAYTRFLQKNKRSQFLSPLILLIEILFPLAFLLSPSLFYFVVFIFLLFHLQNAWVFGLNRFIYSWISSWPGLVFLYHFVKTIY